MVCLVVVLVLAIASASVHSTLADRVDPPLLALNFALLCASFGVGLVKNRRARDELRAGYTTLPFESINVDEVDAGTGGVLRDAGDAFLTAEARRLRRTNGIRAAENLTETS